MTEDAAGRLNDGADGNDGSATAVRREQRLNVVTERYATERVRVSKVIVTEERTITVAVRREELHVTREPLHPDTSPALTDGETEESDLVITLRAEHPIVSMQVVPVERVRISRTTITDTQTVTDTLAKERVELDSTPAHHTTI